MSHLRAGQPGPRPRKILTMTCPMTLLLPVLLAQWQLVHQSPKRSPHRHLPAVAHRHLWKMSRRKHLHPHPHQRVVAHLNLWPPSLKMQNRHRSAVEPHLLRAVHLSLWPPSLKMHLRMSLHLHRPAVARPHPPAVHLNLPQPLPLERTRKMTFLRMTQTP